MPSRVVVHSSPFAFRPWLREPCDVSLTALYNQQSKVTPIAGQLKIHATVDRNGMPVEMQPEDIPGPVGERYRQVWAALSRDQVFVLSNGNRVKNGRAVGCTGLSLQNGEVHAQFEGIPYFALLAAKELQSGTPLLTDVPGVSLEQSFAAGNFGWGPGIAGGSVAVLVHHEGRRYLVTQIKGDEVLNGMQVHPFAFAGGLKQSELHLGLVQLELGTWREYLEEGGNEQYELGRTIGVITEGNPAQFNSFNCVLQRRDGNPITLNEFIDSVMIPYTTGHKPGEPKSALEVGGWHLIDLDRPSIASSHNGLYSTGVSYVIREDPVTGERLLAEIAESRRLVEPVGGVLAEVFVTGSGYRDLLLAESRLADWTDAIP